MPTTPKAYADAPGGDPSTWSLDPKLAEVWYRLRDRINGEPTPAQSLLCLIEACEFVMAPRDLGIDTERLERAREQWHDTLDELESLTRARADQLSKGDDGQPGRDTVHIARDLLLDALRTVTSSGLDFAAACGFLGERPRDVIPVVVRRWPISAATFLAVAATHHQTTERQAATDHSVPRSVIRLIWSLWPDGATTAPNAVARFVLDQGVCA